MMIWSKHYVTDCDLLTDLPTQSYFYFADKFQNSGLDSKLIFFRKRDDDDKNETRRQGAKSSCVCLENKFPCITRTGMSCAIDTAWQKKGFDSLTCNYYDSLDLQIENVYILYFLLCFNK